MQYATMLCSYCLNQQFLDTISYSIVGLSSIYLQFMKLQSAYTLTYCTLLPFSYSCLGDLVRSCHYVPGIIFQCHVYSVSSLKQNQNCICHFTVFYPTWVAKLGCSVQSNYKLSSKEQCKIRAAQCRHQHIFSCCIKKEKYMFADRLVN